MFCPGCGREINHDEAHLACLCGYVPEQEPLRRPTAGFSGDDIINTITSRFNINQLVIFGGCFLLLISLFFPFVSVSVLGSSISTSGFSLISASLGGVMDYFLPIVAVAGVAVVSALNLVALPNPKLIVFCLSLFGLYLALSALFSAAVIGVGFGMVIFFLLWVAVAAAAFMDYRGIVLVRF